MLFNSGWLCYDVIRHFWIFQHSTNLVGVELDGTEGRLCNTAVTSILVEQVEQQVA